MKLLVTGGAGYVGSIATEQLATTCHDVTVIDNLGAGHAMAVASGASFIQADLLDSEAVDQIMQEVAPEAVLHFAARAIVPESVSDPLLYYSVNLAGSINLLNAMRKHDVTKLVFSSTAAVYGVPARIPAYESDPTVPINPYGKSKLMVESILEDCAQAYGLRYVAFRYFNVAGASPMFGEHHVPETHVIPVALAVATGQSETFSIFGDDYPTADGTAVRDYVHVLDLVDAHCVALQHLDRSIGPLNLATREGFSVRQIVEAARRVTDHEIPVEVLPRRAGDPPILVADSSKAKQLLGWEPRRSTLDEMIGSAWNWMQAHPGGYVS